MRTARKLIALGTGCATIAAFVACVASWPLNGAAIRSSIAERIARSTGLIVRVDGPVMLKLLPRPRLKVAFVSAESGDGTIAIDIPTLRSDIDLLALMTGTWRLSSAVLTAPTVTLRLDDAAAMGSAAVPARAEAQAFSVSVRSGILRLVSRRPGVDTMVTEIDGTASQAARDGALTVSGTADWHRQRGRLTAQIAQPVAALCGGSTPATVQLDSTILAVRANGLAAGGKQPRFDGHVSVGVESWASLERALGGTSDAFGPHRASLSGDVALKVDDLSVSQFRAKLDDTAFEGSLAIHSEAGRRHWDGTLATETLDVDRLRADLAHRIDWNAWFRAPRGHGALDNTFDLRVSAAALRIGALDFTQTALSALVQDDRLELTVDGARAYGGEVKARAVAVLGEDGIKGHVETSMSGLDLAALSSAAFGGELVTGTFAGHLVADGRGSTLLDVAHRLSGEGSVSVRHGNLTGLSVSQVLRRFSRRLPVGARLPGQITAFESADATLTVRDGVMAVREGRIVGPGLRMAFGGQSDPSAGNLDIHAVAARTDAEGAVLRGAPEVPFEIKGTWPGPLSIVDVPPRALGGSVLTDSDLGFVGLFP